MAGPRLNHGSVFQGASDDSDRYLSCPVQLQYPGAFPGCRAGGHYIVHQYDVFPCQIGRAGKSTAYVAAPLARREFGLRRGGPLTDKAVCEQGQLQPTGGGTGDLAGLVEAALAQARRMQGHRNEVLIIGMQMPCKVFSQPVGNGYPVLVFERMNDAIDRKLIEPHRQRPLKRRRILEAGATALPVRGWFGTLRAGMARKLGEFGGAPGTQQTAACILAAKQAAGGQQRVVHAPRKMSYGGCQCLR